MNSFRELSQIQKILYDDNKLTTAEQIETRVKKSVTARKLILSQIMMAQ